MKKTIISLLVGAAVTLPATSQAIASNQINSSVQDDIVVAGDVLQIMVPAAGLFAAWMHDDWEGAKQVTYSTIVSATIVEGLKKSTERQRPNELGTSSFPSGILPQLSVALRFYSLAMALHGVFLHMALLLLWLTAVCMVNVIMSMMLWHQQVSQF